jgi:alpha-ribazole phosphatase/probable phosphoglycerate mutase
MTITIDLLRHGDVAGGTKLLGHFDEPLTDLGWQQLRSVVNGETPPWTKIISSPLQRCLAFAEELTDKFDLPLSVESRFKEIGFGQWEGRLLSEIYQGQDGELMMQFWQNPSDNPAPEGESYKVFEQRVVAAWEELLGQHNNDQDHYLLLAHGGVIRTILRNVLNFPMENFFRIDVSYACLSRIRQDVPKHPRLMFLGGRI